MEEHLDDEKIRNDITLLVKDYKMKYKSFVSVSRRCHAPNFSHEGFAENVYHMYQNFNGRLDVQRIGELLEKLNGEYAKERLCKPHSTYKQHVIDKCKKHNMWLFIERNIPFEHVHRTLHDY